MTTAQGLAPRFHSCRIQFCLLVVAVAGVGLYLVWPYLPGWVAKPVAAWFHELPVPRLDKSKSKLQPLQP